MKNLTSINVLIQGSSGAEILENAILSIGRNRQDLFGSPPVKIGRRFRIIDINEDKDGFIECLNQGVDSNLFQKFSANDKFDFIVLPADNVESYSINNFPTEEELKNLMKNGCEVIIRKCDVCTSCDLSVKYRYPNLELNFMNRREIPNYILNKILEDYSNNK